MRITAETKIDIMKKSNIPVAYCKENETVVFETNDCYDNALTYEGKMLCDNYMANPATGPVYIDGAEKGDTLCVDIISVKTNDYGFVKTHFGEAAFENIKRANEHKIIDIRDGYIDFEGKKISLEPMIGVIGVAPGDEEGVITVSAGSHGGNLDCTQVKAGVKMFFPVATEGALFATGDLHAVMGDGEVSGYGLEVQGEVKVKFSLIKGRQIDAPVIYDGKNVMILASAETLDDAVKKATEELYKILLSNGWNESEAAMLMSLKSDLAICQVVNPVKTVRMTINKEYISK